MERYKISVKKSARYFVLGKLGPQVKHVVFVCHGYAQSANEFLEKFKPIQDEKTVIVAPEGLHRFYLRGSPDKVVASWMTQVDREDDIADYVLFMDKVYSEIMKTMKSKVKITLLGFSQGAATASRWAALGNSKINQLILWCGFFPSDISVDKISKTIDLNVVTASDDKFISPSQEKEQLEKIRKSSPQMKHTHFDGQHEIDIPTLRIVIGN